MRRAQTLAKAHLDLGEVEDEFASSVIEGLSNAQKSLPCRYFYDARGSALFEDITRLPEYYPTRTETQILMDYADDMVGSVGDGGLLVEFGSGSSLKTEILLDHLGSSVAYVPIDVSETALADAKARLMRRYPSLDVRPIVADFSHALTFPADLAAREKTGFFPGSTIGNLAPQEAASLLTVFGRALGRSSRLIIGVDLKKDPRRLIDAYNDQAGITAAFNLNLLRRINRELGANFDEQGFRHRAIYDPAKGRIEMHLVSRHDQQVSVCGRTFHFSAGESIHTENSYKYALEQFREVARASGWRPARVWTDTREQFSVHELIWPKAGRGCA
ncbi:methyltransferase [Hyphomicrobium denitrificans 1NES1]|uniref:Methyltransferase n=1 Tax=Hyphomicrobium denitrificans 1NES1 TaxID=670307 RepID=N0AZ65_9HYPH|nr:L-histidine N(alpha)-methyltransferase [Hyphomicrobium denitrificans]AGK56419.1 methyltransferase [Hyphomicrobium denitrificans 1NES1]